MSKGSAILALADFPDGYLSNIPVIIGDLILTEVLQGFKSNKDCETAKELLSALPFRQIDVIIGTFRIMEGLPLLHDDRDFDPMVSHFSLSTPSPQRIRISDCDWV